MNRTSELAYWINEREAMRLAKEFGAKDLKFKFGYHDDPHMGTVRYCNVRREDDKVTRWLAENWRPKYNEVWHILLARLLNRIDTLKAIIPSVSIGSLDGVKNQLKAMRERTPIFGSAYTVSTNGHAMDKVDYIIDRVVKPAKEYQHWLWWEGLICPLESACYELCRLNGVSSFMAGQIIADLKNTKGHPLSLAPDWHTWATPGPGSLRGLTAYFRKPVTPSGFASALVQCYTETRPHLKDWVPELHMQDFQNCLCEFSKYVRVAEGGHARNRYVCG